MLQQTSWVSCIGNNTSNPQVTVPGTSQDTKVLSGRRAFSVQSVDSGFIATQSSRNSQDGTSYGQNSQIVNLQPQPSPYHNVNLSVGSLSPSPFLGVAARPLAHPLQRVKQESGISLWGKHHHRPESGVLIDEDDDTDTDLENEDVSTKINTSMQWPM